MSDDNHRPTTRTIFGDFTGGEFNALDAAGGPRGIAESILPVLSFVIAYLAAPSISIALALSLGLALVLLVARIAVKSSLTYALSGMVGILISVAWVWLTGEGKNYFALGIVAAAGYAIVLIGSILCRYPAVSVVLGLVYPMPRRWWVIPQWHTLGRICRRLTWMWASLFLLRFAVQYPLWVTGNIAALGVAKIVVGLPPFLLCAWVTWMCLRPFHPLLTSANAKQ